MITRKILSVSSSAKPWILTPDTSPQLRPLISDWAADDEAMMSVDDLIVSRPIGIPSAFREDVLSPPRPTLDDILNNRSQPPYTLSAFTAYLSQQHCLETLEFTMDARRYQERYTKIASRLAGIPMSYEQDGVFALQRDWIRILDVYIKPGSPREINLPAEERDDLLDQNYLERPPEPEALEPAVERMYDLMGDSIFMPFLNSFNPASRANTFSTANLDFDGHREGRSEGLKSPFNESEDLLHRRASRRRQTPASSSTLDIPTPVSPPLLISHRPTQSSSLTSAISRSSGSRLSTLVSNSSAASGPEGGLTDDSASLNSPCAGDPMTPPTTPPSSDLPLGALQNHAGPHPSRSDSGSWRKMGIKLWGKRKNGGTLRERLDEG